MDKTSNTAETINSSDDEKFEDAFSKTDNESVINDLIDKQKELLIEPIDEKCEDNNEKFKDCETEVDDESQRDFELTLSEDEKLANKEKSEEFKREGNDFFKYMEYEKSIEAYTSGLKICPVDCSNERSILYANRGAAKIKLEFKAAAIEDCSKAIEFNPNYIKAYTRRAKLYEDTDKLDESLEDFKKMLELEPNNIEAKQALVRLPPLIQERNEKMKDEMMGKLKDLGNMILKPFGLSTSNFQMNQDPSTGGYSINFNQQKQ